MKKADFVCVNCLNYKLAEKKEACRYRCLLDPIPRTLNMDPLSHHCSWGDWKHPLTGDVVGYGCWDEETTEEDKPVSNVFSSPSGKTQWEYTEDALGREIFRLLNPQSLEIKKSKAFGVDLIINEGTQGADTLSFKDYFNLLKHWRDRE